MKHYIYTAIILLSSLVFFSCNNSPPPNTESNITLTLKNFSYTGGKTVYIGLGSGYWPGSPTSTSNLTFGESFPPGASWPQDIEISVPITINDDPNNQEITAELLIASDEDGNGKLSNNDFVMPSFSIIFHPDKIITIPDMLFDTASTETASQFSDTNQTTVTVTINSQLTSTINSSTPVYLEIKNNSDSDFTNSSDIYKNIKLPDKALLTQISIYSVPSDVYYFLLYYDKDSDQKPSSGDNASETDLSNIQTNLDLTSNNSPDITLSVYDSTTIP